jgi:uncharacterized membrane protein YdfJ with MMPL/SSD domain
MLTSIITFFGSIISKIIAFFLGLTLSHIIVLIIGMLLPVLIGLLMTRKMTVKYGIFINKIVGLILLQKKIVGQIPKAEQNFFKKAVVSFQTTLQDIAFGIYAGSLKNESADDLQKKINDYLAG